MVVRKRVMAPLTDAEEAGTQRQIAADPEAPEATDAQLRAAKPFGEMFPELGASIRRARGRPPIPRPKQQVSLRLDPEIVAKFKATGKGR